MFTDPQLQACFDLHFVEGGAGPPELREVAALIATHDWFLMLEGSHSSRVHETIERLLSPGLRPGLRHWYRRLSCHMEAVAIEFRNQLSQLAGERLEQAKN